MLIEITLQRMLIIKDVLSFMQKQCDVVKTMQILKRSTLKRSTLKRSTLKRELILK